MFRGLTRREHAIGVGLLVLLAGGVAVRQWVDQPRYDTAIMGDVIDHPDGQLRLESQAELRLSDAVIDGRIDINAAGENLLQELPSIGPVRAASIVAWREEHGPFARAEDLMRVPGIGEKTLERLRRSIIANPPNDSPAIASAAPGAPGANSPWGLLSQVASPPPATAPSSSAHSVNPTGNAADRPVPINRATEAELQTLSGIGPALARRIVEDRNRRGPFRSPDDLQRVSGIGPVTVEKNRHRIQVH